jgi:hypothetical protein
MYGSPNTDSVNAVDCRNMSGIRLVAQQTDRLIGSSVNIHTDMWEERCDKIGSIILDNVDQ